MFFKLTLTDKFCLASDPYLKRSCESNPELNRYIKKPKFSRDSYDYDVSREGYSPRKLVCKEIHTAVKSEQAWLTSVLVMILLKSAYLKVKFLIAIKSSYRREKCDDAKSAQEVVKIISSFKQAKTGNIALTRYLENNFKLLIPADEEKIVKNTNLPTKWTSQVRVENLDSR